VAISADKLQRSEGVASLAFKMRSGRTCLKDLYQQGCCKVRFPKAAHLEFREAVLINTAGGLTDDDAMSFDISWDAATQAIVTTQAAEKIYRSRHRPARVSTCLSIAENATAAWLPQETIVFDGGRLRRQTNVQLSGNASLFAVESMVLGRSAMSEVVASGHIDDHWRVEIDGRLVFIDALALSDSNAGLLQDVLQRNAVLAGKVAMATFILVDSDLDESTETVRSAIGSVTGSNDLVGGVSNLGPLLVGRLVAADAGSLRQGIAGIFSALQKSGNGRLGGAGFVLPRVWQS
jgi:urease accessory protein